MFGTHDLWLFVLSGLLLNITPGPDTLYIVGRSSSQGWRAGAVAALGVGTGALVHVCAAALGLSAILAASAAAFTAVKIIGAVYLVYVGISLIRSKSAAASPTAAPPPPACRIAGHLLSGLSNQCLESQGGAVLSGLPAPICRARRSVETPSVPIPGHRLRLQWHAVEFTGRLVDGANQPPSRRQQPIQEVVQPLRRQPLCFRRHTAGIGSRSIAAGPGRGCPRPALGMLMLDLRNAERPL